MKKAIIIIALIVVGFLLWKAIQTKPDASVPEATVSDVDNSAAGEQLMVGAGAEENDTDMGTADLAGKTVANEKVKISFIGFGPGKEHEGTFSKITSKLALNTSGKLSGTVSIDMNSMTSDSDKLVTHLKSADFFDVAKYPTATFVVVEDANTTIKGNFTIHGVTKTVTVPFTKRADDISTNFTLNLKEFGIDQAFANETIELDVVVPLTSPTIQTTTNTKVQLQ